MKRSGKWYRKNEADVMRQLGMEPTKNSGSSWIEKEDGQSEYLICQLKSTDANSIRIHKQDLDTLEHNGFVSHKLPVFAIQFLNSDEVYLVLRPQAVQQVAEYLETGQYHADDLLDLELPEHTQSSRPSSVVRSSPSAREDFANEYRAKYKKKEKSAK